MNGLVSNKITGETECDISQNRYSKYATVKFKNSEERIKRDIRETKIECETWAIENNRLFYKISYKIQMLKQFTKKINRLCFSKYYKPKCFIEWIPDQLMEFVSHANIHY